MCRPLTKKSRCGGSIYGPEDCCRDRVGVWMGKANADPSPATECGTHKPRCFLRQDRRDDKSLGHFKEAGPAKTAGTQTARRRAAVRSQRREAKEPAVPPSYVRTSRRYVKRLRFKQAHVWLLRVRRWLCTGVIFRAAVWRTPVLLKGEDKELGRDLAEHLNICCWLVGAQAEAYAT